MKSEKFQTLVDINGHELPCEVVFRYIPAEAQTPNHPYFPEDVEILSANSMAGEQFNSFLIEYFEKGWKVEALEYMHENYDASVINRMVHRVSL